MGLCDVRRWKLELADPATFGSGQSDKRLLVSTDETEADCRASRQAIT